MFLFKSILFISVLITSGVIAFQDFKSRLVSLHILILFASFTVLSVLINRDKLTLFYNAVFALMYLFVLWIGIKAYYFFKYKTHIIIVNHLLGLADIIVIFFIALTFNVIGVILFFCSGFVICLILFLLYNSLFKRKTQSIPLAGFLVIYFIISIIILNLVDTYSLIDNSFVNL